MKANCPYNSETIDYVKGDVHSVKESRGQPKTGALKQAIR